MKARMIITVMAVALTGIFLTALAFSGSGQSAALPPPAVLPPAEPPAGEEALADAPSPSETAAEGFWVCESAGVITVYHNTDRDVPLKTTGTVVATLRLADQEMLRNGVFFENYLDAMSFLEDFAP